MKVRKIHNNPLFQVLALEAEAQHAWNLVYQCKYTPNYVALIDNAKYRGDTTTNKFDWPLYLAELETKENEMLEVHIKNCPYEIAK